MLHTLRRWLHRRRTLAELSHVREFYIWALAGGLIHELPTGRLVRPKVPRRLPRPIAEDALLRAVLTASPRVRAYLVLAGWCGLRAIKIATLRREDVLETADPPLLIVRDGKGQKARSVPLSRVVVDYLGPFLEDRQKGWLFPHRDDPAQPVSPHAVSTRCNEHLRECGLTDTLHALRHRFASELYRITLDLRLTQEMLGHTSPATTAIYTASSPTKAAAAIQELGR